MTITHQTVLGEDGEPTAAIIPWELFQQLVEAQGNDLDDDERRELREALADPTATMMPSLPPTRYRDEASRLSPTRRALPAAHARRPKAGNFKRV